MEKPILTPKIVKENSTSKRLIMIIGIGLITIILAGITTYVLSFKPSPSLTENQTPTVTEETLVKNEERSSTLEPAKKNEFGLISFIQDENNSWPMEWHLMLSPEDSMANEFRIISQLKTPKPENIEVAIGFDKNILQAILVSEREIQPKIGDPVNIKFRLSNNTYKNPNGPRGYQYSDLSAGFSRLGSKNDAGTGLGSVLPYGTSFPIYLLGDTIINKSFVETGDFINSRILLATIYTSGEDNSYVYEIILEKLPIK